MIPRSARPAGARPVIGISAYAARAAWGVWDLDASLVPQGYVDMITAAGGWPVVLPSVAGSAGALLPRLDGLVLAGGPDVDPARYGALPGPDTQPPGRARDEAETELLALAADRAMPVLGICRGLQLMNVVRGGTLVQHLPDLVGTDLHCPVVGRFGLHDVSVVPGTRLAAAVAGPVAAGPVAAGPDADGPDATGQVRTAVLSVPTYHHQGIDRVGAGLVVSARATADGVIEALEDPTMPFWLGVQWHPEADDDHTLASALVAAAAQAVGGPS